MSNWNVQYRYDDSQQWHPLGSAMPLADRAKRLCKALVKAEPHNAHRLQFRLLDSAGATYQVSAPPHKSRMRWVDQPKLATGSNPPGNKAMKAGDIKIFAKSGNEVRLVERDGDGWVVERTKGASAGKQMWCPVKALVDSLD